MPVVPQPDRAHTGPRFRRICVFCGSSPGRDPAYAVAAADTGRLLAERGIGLVYGGGSAGLMGALADAALGAGGDVIGVLPAGLFPATVTATPLRGHHSGSFQLEEVSDMHSRKARFHALSDGYIVLPGGLGTLEEMAEVATWAQIGLHDRPIGFLDVNGYYDPLMAWLDRSVEERFLAATTRGQLHVAKDPAALIDAMAEHEPVHQDKWLDP